MGESLPKVRPLRWQMESDCPPTTQSNFTRSDFEAAVEAALLGESI